MKAADIRVGGRYYCKVSGRVVVVRIDRERIWGSRSQYHGWYAVNESTGRELLIRSAQRLRGEAE